MVHSCQLCFMYSFNEHEILEMCIKMHVTKNSDKFIIVEYVSSKNEINAKWWLTLLDLN